MTFVQKTYCCRISQANERKLIELKKLNSSVSLLSKWIFDNRFFFDDKDFYKACRESFTSLNSKLTQKVLRRYSDVKDIFSLKGPIEQNLLFDNQMFDISFKKEGSYFDAFIRIISSKKGKRINLPLSGLWPLRKLKEASSIDQVEIKKHSNNSFYAHISASFECALPLNTRKSVGVDLNHKNAALSNNTFYSLRSLVHHKDESRKNKSAKKNGASFTKDFINKLTTKIVQDLRSEGIEVLFLEDLSGLRNCYSKKKGTSRGKKLNYRSNSFPFSAIRSQLAYKAFENGMSVIAKKEQTFDTSKECSRCCSKDTIRKTQSTFECLSCGFSLNADLNGARNIERKGRALFDAETSDTPLQTPKSQTAEVSLF